MSLEELNKKYKRNGIFSKIKGSTMAPDRQENIKQLKQAAKLFCVFEDDNEHDPNAIRLYSDEMHLKDLGYIPRELAIDLREFKRNAIDFEIRITAITGNTQEKPTAGANILVILKR
jgi:hypothetical protein